MSTLFSRRAALAGLGAAYVLGLTAAPVAARTRRAEPQGGIHVNVGPLRDSGSVTIAGWVQRLLPAALAEEFSKHGMSGASVTATIDFVMLGSITGAAQPGGASPDQISGQVTVNGVTRPLRAGTNYYPSSADIANFEQTNFYRVQLLVQAFASWAAQGY
jgi:hypothetical protein